MPKSIEHRVALSEYVGGFNSDCDGSGGASGGSILSLSASGKLFLIAINRANDETDEDRSRASKGKVRTAPADDEKSSSGHVLIRGSFLRAI